ncbi:signal peptide protein [Peterkaempfera sp. SMS 1(5)a]|uniref:signal peptide protein n=1 Tax=Peterkaempfera podocarpi TaxID=3232308 RepID=UPI0036729BC5
MPRSTKRTAVTVATSLLVAAGAVGATLATHSGTGSAHGSATAVQAAAAAPVAEVRTVADTRPADVPAGFVDLPTSPLAADGHAHDLTVHYRNTGATARTVALQILVESPDAGPYLSPTDVKLEQLDAATGQWRTVPLGTQTGTLYTTIPASGQQLAPGADLVAGYRVTVQPSSSAAAHQAVLQPRVVLFGPAAGS